LREAQRRESAHLGPKNILNINTGTQIRTSGGQGKKTKKPNQKD